MLVVDQRDQQMLERGIFVAALARLAQRIVEGLFELAGETWHLGVSLRARLRTVGLDPNVIRLARSIKGLRCALSPD